MTADFTNFILWSEIEVNVAMLCSCMPTLVPVLIKAKTAASFDGLKSLLSRKPWSRVKSSHSSLADGQGLPAWRPDTVPANYKFQANGDVQHTLATASTDNVDLERHEMKPNAIIVKQEFGYTRE